MESKLQVFYGILVLLITVTAAPNDVSKTGDILNVAETEKLQTDLEENGENLKQVRQKRFYNYLNFGFPPINPVNYPPRDYTSEVGPYAEGDPLVEIHKRLQGIADAVKQPAPPPPSFYPIFYPVILVPQLNCNCFPDNNVSSTPAPQPNSNTNGTLPDVETRLPELEDERQNWGLVVNENDADDDEDLNNRPISFDPIKVRRPMKRPPPPVDHGSRQGDSGNVPTTTIRPPQPPVSAFASVASFGRPQEPQAPSTCEKAVLSCCHQMRVTYECFVSQGCPNLSSVAAGNPCSPDVIVRVIDRFQNYYGLRNGV